MEQTGGLEAILPACNSTPCTPSYSDTDFLLTAVGSVQQGRVLLSASFRSCHSLPLHSAFACVCTRPWNRTTTFLRLQMYHIRNR
jgi:hypothetical protein